MLYFEREFVDEMLKIKDIQLGNILRLGANAHLIGSSMWNSLRPHSDCMPKQQIRQVFCHPMAEQKTHTLSQNATDPANMPKVEGNPHAPCATRLAIGVLVRSLGWGCLLCTISDLGVLPHRLCFPFGNFGWEEEREPRRGSFYSASQT